MVNIRADEITAKGSFHVEGDLYVKEQNIYQVIADVVMLMSNPHGEAAIWLTSSDVIRREFVKTILEKLKHEQETNTNSD